MAALTKAMAKKIQRVVQDKLDAKRELAGTQLTVADFVLDPDGWVHYVVGPEHSNVRAYEFARALAEVELELRADGIRKVILVPAIPDFLPPETRRSKGGEAPPAGGMRTRSPGKPLPAKRKGK